jgi:hypothetical protein
MIARENQRAQTDSGPLEKLNDVVCLTETANNVAKMSEFMFVLTENLVQVLLSWYHVKMCLTGNQKLRIRLH